MLQAVETAASGCGNHYLMGRLMTMLPSLREGAHIADVLEQTRQFPNEVIHMAHVGERTGDLDSLLHKVAEYMEEEADAAASKALLIVLPFLLVLTGVVFLYRCLPLIHQYLSPFQDLMNE
jgi:type IV pilus assembly protein PilC